MQVEEHISSSTGNEERAIDHFNAMTLTEGSAVLLARLFVLHAGELLEALDAVPVDDPTRPFLNALTNIALEAGLELLEIAD